MMRLAETALMLEHVNVSLHVLYGLRQMLLHLHVLIFLRFSDIRVAERVEKSEIKPASMFGSKISNSISYDISSAWSSRSLGCRRREFRIEVMFKILEMPNP